MTELGPQHICMHGVHLSQPCQKCASNEVRRQAFFEVCATIIPAWHMSFCPAYNGSGACVCNIEKIIADIKAHA